MTNKYIIDEERLYELLKSKQKLQELQNAGIDNWEGYDIAFEDYDDSAIEE